MENKRIQELRYNTLIIAVANISSKAIIFILAPLYSFYLTTEQYGTMDLITTTASLLLPFVCFDVFEATFRYVSDASYDDGKVLSSSLAEAFTGTAITATLVLLAVLFGITSPYVVFTGIVVVLESINQVLRQFARGRAQMKIFAFSGIVEALGLLISNLLFLVLLRYQLNGWMLSYLIGKLLSLFYLTFSTKALRFYSVQKIDRNYIAQFIRFCMPLVPTATMWWIMNVSDRYVITFFWGVTATGIYAVANKIPSILNVLANVFYQSWQTTAINMLDEKHRDEFYSSVLSKYIIMLLVVTAALLLVAKPMIFILFAPEYVEAWKCLPLLLVGIVFHSIASNLGSLYTVFKATAGAFYSSLTGALTNIVLNFLAVPKFGIIGAAFTTLLGFIVTFIYRWFDIKRFVQLKFNYKKLLPTYVATGASFVLYYWSAPISYLLRMIIAVVLVVYHRKLIIRILRKE